MAYASSGGKSVKTSGSVGGSGEVDTHVTAIKAGSNVTLTSDANRVVTIASTGGGGSGNTLDQAYDQGSAGGGKQIDADSGAVKIVSDQNECLHLQATAASINPLLVEGDSNAVSFGVSGEDAGSVLVCAGPIQTSQQLVADGGGAQKTTDSTAIDLQVGATDPAETAQGTFSAIIGGQANAIADVGVPSVPQGAGQATSTRAACSIIAGGNSNRITSTVNTKAAENSGIFSGYRNSISWVAGDDTARGGIGVAPTYNVITGAGVSTITNGGSNTISGGTMQTIHTHTQGAIIGGEQNSLLVPSSGTTSAGIPRNNAIIGGELNKINPTMDSAYNFGDASTHQGQNNVIVGGDGNEVEMQARSCLVMGDSGKASTDGSDNDDAVLIVGGRPSSTPHSDLSTDNAFIFVGISSRHNGTSDAGKGYADVSFNGGGADYAEMFEWNDGNPNDEDRVGLFVKISSDGTLPNGKIEVGGDGRVIGPVSSRPGMVVNNPGMRWNSKYVVDDFGRYVLDSNGNAQINPNFDDSLSYKGRSSRKEWSPIALKGRVRVRASTNIGIYPSNKSGLTVNVNADGTVSDAGAKGKYKVLQVVKQKEIWSGPQGLFRSRDLIQDHGYGVVEILVE
tara:strand:+ start:3801 stop:5666 length:1866 start_codon:yes stop_codon:yes gene_type:complete